MTKRRYQTTADVETRARGETPPGLPPSPRRFRSTGWVIAGCLIGALIIVIGLALALGG
jgi:hypothetical protein